MIRECAGERIEQAGQRDRLGEVPDPALDFVALAHSMGMSAERATTADELVAQLRRAFAEPGPHLIEAMVPPMV